MDYRCQYCGRKLDTGLRCKVCDAKRSAGDVKIMTTPTKEQVEEVFNNVFCGETHETVRLSFLALITRIIIVWEKIKDVDARVEKMCKNNPGIKDFEDFNKAINSPK